MIAAVPDTPAQARGDAADQRRPAAVLIVYSWDLLRAILALFGVLASFSGGVAVGTRQVALALPVQIVAALSSAAFAATLMIVASLLTRRRLWVRRVQMVTLGAAIGLAALSLVVGYATASGIELGGLLGTVLFMLLD